MLNLAIRFFGIICILLFRLTIQAQPGGIMSNTKYDGSFTVGDCYKKSTIITKFKADTIKSNYILKGEKIWRTINLENRQNQLSLNNGGKCSEVGLFEVMKFGLFVKHLNAFSSDDFNETKQHKLSNEQILKSITVHDTSVVDVFDANGDKTSETIIDNRYMYGQDIKSFILKEDWFINSYTGKIEKRIIGIAPLIFDNKQQKTVPLFWLYYAEWKQLFASFEARNFYSDQVISFDDVFMNKYFISVLSKQSNIFDRSIKTEVHGKDIYSEGEKIHEKLNTDQEDLFPK